MVIMDSGLGGLSVVRALRALAPTPSLFYLADTAGFPYGKRSPDDITARAAAALTALAEAVEFSTVVLACNTLSTLSLAALRAQLPYRFVGTVPAIKVAANASRSRRFTLLATPNTAHSLYTQQLIAEFAADCIVDCYGAPNLAAMTEDGMLGKGLDEGALRAELLPAFFDDRHGKTDAVILGCTHYPLLGAALPLHAPWPVRWIDASQAIARQALAQATSRATQLVDTAYVTSGADVARYAHVFAAEGFAATNVLAI